MSFTKALQRLRVLLVGVLIRQMLRTQFRKEVVCSKAEQGERGKRCDGPAAPVGGRRRATPSSSAGSSGVYLLSC